jgi:hypothetical protein
MHVLCVAVSVLRAATALARPVCCRRWRTMRSRISRPTFASCTSSKRSAAATKPSWYEGGRRVQPPQSLNHCVFIRRECHVFRQFLSFCIRCSLDCVLVDTVVLFTHLLSRAYLISAHFAVGYVCCMLSGRRLVRRRRARHASRGGSRADGSDRRQGGRETAQDARRSVGRGAHATQRGMVNRHNIYVLFELQEFRAFSMAEHFRLPYDPFHRSPIFLFLFLCLSVSFHL